MNEKGIVKGIGNRFGWLMVLGATLTMSDYSLFYVARHFGTPPVFAVLGGVIFDGAAILFADYSLKHARAGSSGSGPRIGVLLCAGLSAFLNSQHAVIAHQIAAARLFWAAPPVIAVTAYEFHIKWERRRALANAGRVPADLPVFGKWAWALFPVKTFRIARTVVRYRLGIILSRHTPGMVHQSPAVPVPGSPELPAGEGSFPGSFPELAGTFGETMPVFGQPAGTFPGTTKHAREWARAMGYQVSHRGPLSADILHEYIKALNTPKLTAGGTGLAETESDTDDTEIGGINGYGN